MAIRHGPIWEGTSEDCDSNGVPDECQPDFDDGDGIVDTDDNCPLTANADQADADGDGTGDACDDSPYLTATLKHWGFDFSDGVSGDENGDAPNSDGNVITWVPNGSTTTATQWDTNLWFRTEKNVTDGGGSPDSYIKDMGAVELSSVTTSPPTWDGGGGEDLPPLQADHVYVVQCMDGYAKFLVKEMRTTPEWEVDVEYVYSSSNTFAN